MWPLGGKNIFQLYRCTPHPFILQSWPRTLSFLSAGSVCTLRVVWATWEACKSRPISVFIHPGPVQGGFEGLVNTLQIFSFDGLLIALSAAPSSALWLLQKLDIGISPIERIHSRSHNTDRKLEIYCMDCHGGEVKLWWSKLDIVLKCLLDTRAFLLHSWSLVCLRTFGW